MQKDDLNGHVFQYKYWCSPKSDQLFFFLTLTIRRTFHWKDFTWKKNGGTGLISEKTEVLYAELNERAEAVTGSYSVTGDSLQYIYFVPVTNNRQSIQSRCLFHEFSQIFLTILIMVTEQLYQRTFFCGWFYFKWLWLLTSIMKRWAERCTLQLYQTSLRKWLILQLFYCFSIIWIKFFLSFHYQVYTFFTKVRFMTK